MFNFKKYRQWAEGLSMLEDGIEVQLRQAEYRLQRDDLSEEDLEKLESSALAKTILEKLFK
jgi:hypothetical protein